MRFVSAPGASGDAANFDHAVKTAWTMLGLVLGAIVSVFADRHYTRFETQAVWWAQILKVVLGLALTLAVRVALKAPLTGGLWREQRRRRHPLFCRGAHGGHALADDLRLVQPDGSKKVIYSRSKTCYTLPARKKERRSFFL